MESCSYRHRLATGLLTLVVTSLAVPASGYVGARAECDGNRIVLSVGMTDHADRPGQDWIGVIIYRRTIGFLDDEPLALNADQPIAWTPADGEDATVEFVDEAIEANRGYGYFCQAVDADGVEHWDLHPQSIGTDWAGCGEFAYARGELGWEWYGADTIILTIDDPCDGYLGGCACRFLTSAEFFADWFVLVGQFVEFRGEYAYDGMPTDMCCVWTTDAVVHVADCAGQVATQPMSWSALKRLYD